MFFRWLGRTVGSAVTIVLVVVLLPHASRLAARLLPDESGAAIRASAVLSSKLNNSARLETLCVEETGVMTYDFDAALIGKVGGISISYDYSGSFGVDLKDVQLRIDNGVLVFMLPEPVLIQDVLTPTEIYRDDFWYPGFDDKDYEKLLEDERRARRAKYLSGESSQALWDASVAAFEDTIAVWMQELDGNLSFRYERLVEQDVQ